MIPRIWRGALILLLAASTLAMTETPAGAADWFSYGTTVHGDPADVYAPTEDRDPLPVALLLQGANVDKAHYRRFAAAVASYGFVVVVPNHRRALFGQQGLFAEQAQAGWAVEWAEQEGSRADSPLFGLIDSGSLVLLGHSFGGAAALALSAGECTPVFCPQPATPPAELKGLALYGTNNIPPGGTTSPPVANNVPVQLVQGATDGVAAPWAALSTYEAVIHPPKMLVTVLGANHYGITDQQNPPGAQPDPSEQTIGQEVGIASAARWSAMFLRTMLGDPWSAIWLYVIGPVVDRTVNVTATR